MNKNRRWLNYPFKKLYFYLIKNFLLKTFYVTSVLCVLILIINLFDIFEKIGSGTSVWGLTMLSLALLPLPGFIQEVSVFLILLASTITLFDLSIKSEITVMRSVGLSLWQILTPLIISSFILGIISVSAFDLLAVKANEKLEDISRNLSKDDTGLIIAPPAGVWLKQPNVSKPEEVIIIRAEQVYKDKTRLGNTTLWFFNKNKELYKRIDASSMELFDYYWSLREVVVNEELVINLQLPQLKVPTNFKSDFIMQKIVNNFEKVKLFSIFDLPSLILSLKEAGFSSRKFEVHYYYLLSKPFLFIAMVLLSAFFSITTARIRNNVIYAVIGVMIGLVIYIILAIVNMLGSIGMLPPFAATWLVAIVLLSASVLLIFEKENL